MTATEEPFWRRALRSLGRASAPPVPACPPEAEAVPAVAGYRLQCVIARGSGSALYGAIDLDTGSPVALKLVELDDGDDGSPAQAQARFLQAAQAAAALVHPHIVAVHETRVDGPRGLVAMELLSGGDLSRYTRPSRLLPEPVVLEMGAKIASALAHAHALDIVHRDIKPANVVVDLTRGLVKVTDFGIARVMDGSRSRSGVLVGTPLFMAPEQLAGAQVDGRADLYALGVLLYQLLSGRLPFEAGGMGELLRQVARGEGADLAAHRPDLPPPLLALVRSLLHRDPEQRPGDGDEVAARLRTIVAAWPPSPRDLGASVGGSTPREPADPGHNPSPP